MIESITIADVATFGTSPEVLCDLRHFNYVFGSNGTGKTTISRVIADPAFNTTCQCKWKNGTRLETMVLNRDFVEKNFGQLRGTFTLGEKQRDTEERIKAAKEELDNDCDKLDNLKRNLEGDEGDDEAGGKKGALAKLEANYRDKFWVPIEKI